MSVDKDLTGSWPLTGRHPLDTELGSQLLYGALPTLPVEPAVACDRPHTGDRKRTDQDGRTWTIVTVQRCCNGCGNKLGDATDDDLDAGMTGQPLPDVRSECPSCAPHAALARTVATQLVQGDGRG